MNHHLVILKKTYLARILSGTKSVECRLSRTRRPPFGAVSVDDTLWLKQSGGPVVAKTTVRSVTFLHPLADTRLKALQARYGDALGAPASFFEEHARARFATLIQLGRVRRIGPLYVRKSDRHAWVVLADPLC